MSVALAAFDSRLLPDLPGCPTVLARNILLDVVIEFCDKSLVWIADLAKISTVNGTPTYTLTAPAGAVLSQVLSVRHNTNDLAPYSEAELDALVANWRAEKSNQARAYTQPQRTQIRLYPYPDITATDTVEVTAALKPSRTATTVENFIFDDYAEAVCSGAKARLMVMTDKPWTNPNLALWHADRFGRAIGKARIAGERGHVRKENVPIIPALI